MTPRPSPLALVLAGIMGLTGVGHADAQGSIYTCVDAAGRTITSDRPITSCADRMQRELDRSGITRRVIEPELTAAEREAQEKQERAELAEKRRTRELARRDRALMIRYPNRETHDKERAQALARANTIIDAAISHLDQLRGELGALEAELEFYQNNPERAPRKLREAIKNNRDAQDVTLQLIADQHAERKRINAQFDEEASHIERLWQANDENADTSDTAAPDNEPDPDPTDTTDAADKTG